MVAGLKTPDITLAQLTAAVSWVVVQLLAMGVIDDNTAQLVVQVASTALSAVWFIADAFIRNGRAKAVAATAAVPTAEV